MHGPLTSIEISDIGDRIGRRIPVTVAATGRTIYLPAKFLFFVHHHVIMPRWLYRKYERYLEPGTRNPQRGKPNQEDCHAS